MLLRSNNFLTFLFEITHWSVGRPVPPMRHSNPRGTRGEKKSPCLPFMWILLGDGYQFGERRFKLFVMLTTESDPPPNDLLP